MCVCVCEVRVHVYKKTLRLQSWCGCERIEIIHCPMAGPRMAFALSRAHSTNPALPYSYLPLPFLLSSAMLTYTLLHDVDCMVRCCAVVCLWYVCGVCGVWHVRRAGLQEGDHILAIGQNPLDLMDNQALLSVRAPSSLHPSSPHYHCPSFLLHHTSYSPSIHQYLFFPCFFLKRSICSIFHLIHSLPFFFSLLLLDIALHFVPSARRLTTQ